MKQESSSLHWCPTSPRSSVTCLVCTPGTASVRAKMLPKVMRALSTWNKGISVNTQKF